MKKNTKTTQSPPFIPKAPPIPEQGGDDQMEKYQLHKLFSSYSPANHRHPNYRRPVAFERKELSPREGVEQQMNNRLPYPDSDDEDDKEELAYQRKRALKKVRQLERQEAGQRSLGAQGEPEELGVAVEIVDDDNNSGFTVDPYIESRKFSVVMIVLATVFEVLLLSACFGYYNQHFVSGVGYIVALYGDERVQNIVVFTVMGLLGYLGAVTVWLGTFLATTAKNSFGVKVPIDPAVRGNRNTWGVMLLTLVRDFPAFILHCMIWSCCGMHHDFQGFVMVLHTIYFILAFLLSWSAYVRLFAQLIRGEGIGVTQLDDDSSFPHAAVLLSPHQRSRGSNSSSHLGSRAQYKENGNQEEEDANYSLALLENRVRGPSSDRSSVLQLPLQPRSREQEEEAAASRARDFASGIRSINEHDADPEYDGVSYLAASPQHHRPPSSSTTVGRGFSFGGNNASPAKTTQTNNRRAQDSLDSSAVDRTLDMSNTNHSPSRGGGQAVATWSF